MKVAVFSSKPYDRDSFLAAFRWLAHPTLRIIAAHWGGGLPFYALMPELRALIDEGRVAVDTAASRYLYAPEVFTLGPALTGAGAVMWGSDFPLRSQAEDRAELEAAVVDPALRAAILGGNAARFLGLDKRER